LHSVSQAEGLIKKGGLSVLSHRRDPELIHGLTDRWTLLTVGDKKGCGAAPCSNKGHLIKQKITKKMDTLKQQLPDVRKKMRV
jgi:hypothetical protein